MLENRPIVATTIGYILGIIMGLYCKNSIVLFYILFFSIYPIIKRERKRKFRLISIRRYFRYVKIIFTKKVILIIIISSIISNSIVLYQNKQYQKIYSMLNEKEINTQGTIISNVKERGDRCIYKIKLKRKKHMYLSIKNKDNIQLKYGDKVNIKGIYKEPQSRTNYRGFDYKEYCKTQKIYGTIEAKKIEKYSENKNVDILGFSNMANLKIKELIKKDFKEKYSDILIGIILGNTEEMNEDIKERFSDSNISYVLAVSGMHVGYLILICKIFFCKMFGKRMANILTILILIINMFITGFSSSVVRASVTAILILFSKLLYRKSDNWQNICFSALILLIYNPFLIKNVSVLLSFWGTIGIILIPNQIKNIISVAFFSTLFIVPILIIYFHQLPITSLTISLLIGFIVSPIYIVGIIFLVLYKILIIANLKVICIKVISFFVEILIKMTEIGAKLPLNKIYLTTPNLFQIIIYYLFILIRLIFILGL